MRRSQVEIGVTAATAVLSFCATTLNAPVFVAATLGITLFISLGYVWIIVLFGHDVRSLERVAVGAALALSVPVLGGLALQAVGIPMHRISWNGLISGLTLIGDAVLIARKQTTQPDAASRRFAMWIRPGRHAVIFGAAVVVAAGAVALASVSATIQHYPGFTQLWLTSHKNTTTARLGVGNEEGKTKHYRLVLLRNGRTSNVWDLAVSNGQSWQRTIQISNKYVTVADLYLLPDLVHPYRHVSTASNKASR